MAGSVFLDHRWFLLAFHISTVSWTSTFHHSSLRRHSLCHLNDMTPTSCQDGVMEIGFIFPPGTTNKTLKERIKYIFKVFSKKLDIRQQKTKIFKGQEINEAQLLFYILYCLKRVSRSLCREEESRKSLTDAPSWGKKIKFRGG